MTSKVKLFLTAQIHEKLIHGIESHTKYFLFFFLDKDLNKKKTKN